MIVLLASAAFLVYASTDTIINGADLLGWILVTAAGVRLMRRAARA